MIFKETANKELPTIILLHGGGLSDWSWQYVVQALQLDFHLVTPVIEGHGEDGHEEFISIQYSATKLIDYIDTYYNGKVFAICGLSIGAQIVTEVLSKREAIAEYAVIESALVYPIKGINTLVVPSYKLFYGLVQKRWFAKLQAKSLCVPDHMFEVYYNDSLKMTRESLINMTLSNGNYTLQPSISNTKAKVLIIVGSKEVSIMKKSAYKLHESIKGSELLIAPHMKHGELSLVHTEKYIELIKALFTK